ncbi:hypothetical protein ACJJTC_011775 [Scirpophaga incertulas]
MRYNFDRGGPGRIFPGLLGHASIEVDHNRESGVSEYLEENSILPEVLSGFRKDNSTAAALLVVDNILQAWDNNKSTISVLLNNSRAFDCNSIPLLSKMFYLLRFDNATVKQFYSYLSDCIAVLRIDESVLADPQLVFCGSGNPVRLNPQDLILIFYISD